MQPTETTTKTRDWPESLEPSRRDRWLLDPATIFLNHGSFGAAPRQVLDYQTQLRQQMEKQPVEFFVRQLPELLDSARTALSRFIGANADDVAFVPNVTAGFNAVLRSLSFAAGDELLTTGHAYNATLTSMQFVAERSGAKVVVADLPLPLRDAQQAIDAILERVNERTRLAVVDHVTSQTGVVLPIADIVAALAERGVDTLVDAAHAPGMVAVDVGAINAAYYTGNCHKWICAPKGAGFLVVRRDRQSKVRPLAISHGANAPAGVRSRFLMEFDWTGTDDPTAFLAVPKALEVMRDMLPGGWPAVRQRNHAMVVAARALLCETLGAAPLCPDEMLGSLASLPLPDGSGEPPTSALYADPLQDSLMAAGRIEVPVIPWPASPKRLLRISAQLYNRRDEYERLAEVLPACLA